MFLWRNTAGGFGHKFSSRVTWNRIRVHSPTVSWSNAVWFKEEIPRCYFIIWLAINQRLPTKDRLISWGMQVPDACVLCDAATESHQPLFFNCPFVKAVWLRFCGRLLTAPPYDINSAITIIQQRSQASQSASWSVLKLILQVMAYNTWKERNARIFRNEYLSEPGFFLLVDRTIRDRLLSIPTPSDASVSLLGLYFSFTS